MVSFHVFFTSFHYNPHCVLHRQVTASGAAAFMEPEGTALTGGKLRSHNKHCRGPRVQVLLSRFIPQCSRIPQSYMGFLFCRREKASNVSRANVYVCSYRQCVCAWKRSAVTLAARITDRLRWSRAHYMCRVRVRRAVEEKGMCLAVEAEAVTRRRQRAQARSRLTTSSTRSRPSEPIWGDYKASASASPAWKHT